MAARRITRTNLTANELTASFVNSVVGEYFLDVSAVVHALARSRSPLNAPQLRAVNA